MTHERQSLLKLSLTFFAVGVIALWVLVANTGCATQPYRGVEKGVAPTSSVSREQTKKMARTLVWGFPNLYLSEIAPTGSMEPQINSYTIVLMERTDGSDVLPNQIVSYTQDEYFILHKVLAVTPTHFQPAGIHNFRTDGWIPRDRIVGRLVAPFYTKEGLK